MSREDFRLGSESVMHPYKQAAHVVSRHTVVFGLSKQSELGALPQRCSVPLDVFKQVLCEYFVCSLNAIFHSVNK